ncbi:MAG: Npt1/Npt2 family nucleotide transporter [bacterium]
MNRKGIRYLADIRRDEWAKVALMHLFFFLVIMVFQILKPMKQGLFLEALGPRAAEWELIAKLLNIVVAVAAAAVFSYLAGHLRRTHLTAVFGLFFFVAFFLYSRMLASPPGALAIWTFYLLGDLFSTVMVAVFWAFLNDISPPAQARRLYGVIGAGGVIGGYVGNTVVREFVEAAGTDTLLHVCMGLTAVIMVLARAVDARYLGKRRGSRPSRARQAGTESAPSPAGSGSGWAQAVEGARLVRRSGYLLCIAGLVGIYEIVSATINYQYSATVVHLVGGAADKQVFLATVGQVTGIVSILSQILLTGFLLSRFGVGAALMLLPVAVLGSSLGFLLAPSLAMGAAMVVSSDGLNYSIYQTSKEVLYTPTSRAEKYKAKAFIDMFVQRFSKGIGIVISLAFAAITQYGAVRFLSLFVAALLAALMFLIRYLAGAFERRTGAIEEAPITSADIRAQEPEGRESRV